MKAGLPGLILLLPILASPAAGGALTGGDAAVQVLTVYAVGVDGGALRVAQHSSAFAEDVRAPFRAIRATGPALSRSECAQPIGAYAGVAGERHVDRVDRDETGETYRMAVTMRGIAGDGDVETACSGKSSERVVWNDETAIFRSNRSGRLVFARTPGRGMHACDDVEGCSAEPGSYIFVNEVKVFAGPSRRR